jgi:hypothetical protein
MTPMREQTGNRRGDLLYSSWHRPASTSRWLPMREADALQMINIDALPHAHRARARARQGRQARALAQPEAQAVRTDTDLSGGSRHRDTTGRREAAETQQ